MKKLIAILLTAILLISVVPAVSAAQGKTSTASIELKDLPDDFASAVNEYIPPRYKDDYPTFTNESLDGIEFYKVTKELVVFRIVGLNNNKSKELINGYLFTAPTWFGDTSINSCGYCVYSGGKVYRIYDAVKGQKIITLDELKELIPNTVYLDNDNLVSHFKENGIDVSWVKIIAVNSGHMICYAGSGTATDCDETLEFREYNFHITKAQSPDALGLYMVDVSRVAPFSNMSEVSYDYYRLAEYIRKAEAEGMEFGFTISHKFGEEAEACIDVMNANNNYPFTVTGFGKLKNHNLYAISVGSIALEALTYNVLLGNWLFNSGGQNFDYDLGIYLVDIDEEKLYTLDEAYDGGVLNDDDIDDVIDKIGTSGSGWTAKKLTDLEKKFLEYKYGEGNYLFGEGSRKHVYGYTCTQHGEFDGYTVVSVSYGGFFEVKLGDYIVSYKKVWGIPYLYKDDEFKTMEEAYADGIINENNLEAFVAFLVENELASARVPDALETAIVNRLNEDGGEIISAEYAKLCDVDDCELYKVIAGRGDYSEIIGDFTITCPTSGAKPMILKDGVAYTLTEACDKNLVKIEDVYAAYKANQSSNSIFQFAQAKHNYHAFLDYVMNHNEGISKSSIKVDRYDVLTNGTALVEYYIKGQITEDVLDTYLIDKYFYTSGRPSAKIFDGNELYEISDAYNKGIIGKTELSDIAKKLDDFKESKFTFKAGYSDSALNIGGACLDAKYFTSSNTKVVKIKSGKVIALTKGTATLTYKPKNSKNAYVKVTVKNNPTLSKTSVTVKKGKTVSVKISGKAAEINNVYKNTKYAKVISAKSAKTIKIRGLKKGKTTLKITVNGKLFKLKVKVK